VNPPFGWDEATLLHTLPKNISIELQPTEAGGWLASISGISGLSAEGRTQEAAELLVLDVLYEFMVARRELALAKCGKADGS
jgi:hypothetical protein